MFNLLSKFLAPQGFPLILVILLAVCGLLAWKRRRLAFRLLVVAVALLLLFSSRIAERALVRSLEDQYPDKGLNVQPAQAIVVLGGSLEPPSGVHHLSGLTGPSDRLLVALRLYRAGKAPLVFCSGGNNPIATYAAKSPEAMWMARLLEEWGIPAVAIEIEGESINTRENATLSYRALEPRGIRRILLVTSAMHMPRAAGAFRKVGFEVVAAPADFHTGWDEGNPLEKWLPSADHLRNSEAAIHEWLGIAAYRLRGWL